jgi:hypothetical protein
MSFEIEPMSLSQKPMSVSRIKASCVSSVISLPCVAMPSRRLRKTPRIGQRRTMRDRMINYREDRRDRDEHTLRARLPWFVARFLARRLRRVGHVSL